MAGEDISRAQTYFANKLGKSAANADAGGEPAFARAGESD
jgi:hypothetical protein